ncbi:MAG: hypothetical protein AAF204_02300 [Pseudomonadota bacterium]
MVDSVNGAGGPQNVSQVNRTQSSRNSETRRQDQASGVEPADQVELSEEALVAQAEATAQETRSLLEENSEETLSSSRQRVDTLL